MADVDDQWHKLVDGKKVRTDKYGRGKRWRARWRDETGAQRQTSFDTKTEADRHIATVKADMLRKTYIDPAAGKVTFKSYAERWRAAQIHEDSSVKQVESRLRLHVYPFFGDRQIASIKPSEAQRWIRVLENGGDGRAPLMPATVEVIYQFTNAIFAAAIKDKVVGTSPFDGLKRSKIVPKRVAPPSLEQVNAIYAAMPEKYRALVTIGSGIGLRQGEAVALELDCIDFLGRKLNVRQQLICPTGAEAFLRLPKGRKTRSVALAGLVVDELSRHVKEFGTTPVEVWDRTNLAKPVRRRAEFLFVDKLGMPIRSNTFSARLWAPARRAAKLPTEMTFHDLRHFFASLLIRYGESVKTVQHALGHATAGMTLEVYGHLWPDSEDRTRLAIEAGFKGDVGAMWADLAGGAESSRSGAMRSLSS